MGAAINTFSGAKIEALPGYPVAIEALRFMPNLVVPKGTLLGQVSAANATEVQTLTYGASPAGGTGTYTLSIAGPDGATYTSSAITGDGLTAVALQAVINALLVTAGYNVSAGNAATGVTVTVTGTTTTGAFTITFAGTGAYANMPQISSTVIDLVTSGAAAITVTMATSTAGVTQGLWGPYVGTKLADPALPTVAWKGSAGYFPVDSTCIVSITHLTAAGESLPSPGKIMVKSAATDSLDVTPAALPTGCTGINIYVDGVLAATSSQTSATLVNVPGLVTTLALGALAGKAAPRVSTAYTNTDGRHVAKAIAMRDFRTNNLGKVAYTTASGQEPQNGIYDESAPAFFIGAFKTSELVTNGSAGITQAALDDLQGRLLRGTLTDGVVGI